MLDGLPLEVVVRIGELGRWNERTFLALSQVSKIYRKTVQGLHPFAQRFNLRDSGWTNADDVPLTRANGLLSGVPATRKWHGA